jgi:hypothetical protein
MDRLLNDARSQFGGDSLAFANFLAEFGSELLKLGEFSRAEKLLRDDFVNIQTKAPDGWISLQIQGLLGAAILGQARQLAEIDHSAAEPLFAEAKQQLLTSYEGLKRQAPNIPAGGNLLVQAIDRLIDLAKAMGDELERKKWMAEKERLAK